MASGPPVIRLMAWVSVISQMAVMLALVTLASWLQFSPYLGIVVYLGLSIGLRSLLTRDHRRGMFLVRRGQYAEAISLFEQSYRFFSRFVWLDRWRYLLLLSSNRMSYREMALVNMAFCYTQIGEGKQAQVLYQRALDEFGSAIAQVALKMMESVKNITNSDEDGSVHGGF